NARSLKPAFQPFACGSQAPDDRCCTVGKIHCAIRGQSQIDRGMTTVVFRYRLGVTQVAGREINRVQRGLSVIRLASSCGDVLYAACCPKQSASLVHREPAHAEYDAI